MECTKCHEDKPPEEFHQRKAPQRKRQAQQWCKGCRKLYDREYHKKRYESGRKQEQFKANRARNQKFIFDYLIKHPCARCGEKDPEVLEFDHISGRKVKEIGLMVGGAWSLERIQEELKKCQVLCANCHHRKTAEQFGYWILGYTRA